MYTKETSPIYTQEDLDRLIEQRRELDDKIDEVEAYIRQESVGKLEDEYRKLLVGKILVSTNDWGHGSFTCRFISDVAVAEDFRGTKELKMYAKKFVIDPDQNKLPGCVWQGRVDKNFEWNDTFNERYLREVIEKSLKIYNQYARKQHERNEE